MPDPQGPLAVADGGFPVPIGADELATRRARLLEHMRRAGAAGLVLWDPHRVLYFTGFAYIPTERPIAFVMNESGESAMFVPRLELEHARSRTGFERVDHYIEYPHDPHPMLVLVRTLESMGVRGSVASDHDGYPWVLGYRGPALSELTGSAVLPITGVVEDLMMVKSPAEVALIRESCRWGHLAHRLLHQYTRVGVTETEVSQRASQEATREMIATLAGHYRSLSMWADGPSAGYRGQIGRQSAIPHALNENIVFQPGDVLVTGASCPMWGYESELERTMFVGAPSAACRTIFDHMCQSQELAIAALRPGTPCSEVDRRVREYYEAQGLLPHWKHHTGHAIGLRYHEGPFLDVGDRTAIEVGMVFTVEPGLYLPELGGFRHSDTVLVTAGGPELLTDYPRDLESLTIPA